LPPDGVTWHCIPISDLYVEDKINPDCGLLCPWLNNPLPFIQLPRTQALSIIGLCGLNKIYPEFEACEKFRKVSLVQSDQKRIFTNYGKPVIYLCGSLGFEE
jgi:hypothetical protein